MTTPLADLSVTLGDLVLEQLLKHGRYHLPGFGVFTLRLRPARRIQHPITRETMWLPSTPEVRFRASKVLKQSVGRRLKASGRPLAAPPTQKLDTEVPEHG